MSSVARVGSLLPETARLAASGTTESTGEASHAALDGLRFATANAAPHAGTDLGLTRTVGVVALGLVIGAGLRARARSRRGSAQGPKIRHHRAEQDAEAGPPSPRSGKRSYFYRREAADLRARGKSFKDFAREFYDFEDGPCDGRFIHAASTALYRKLQALGDDFAQLVVDPGLMSRIDEFVAFVGRLPEQERMRRSPWQLRDLFSAHLGTTDVWRVLTLTPEELKTIRRDGLLAHGLVRERKGKFRTRWADGSQTLITRMTQTIERQVDELMPVTKTPRVVYSSLELPPGRRQGKEIYVLKLQIPELDLLAPRRCRDSLNQPSVLGYEKNGDIVFHPPEIEQFLPFYSAPSEIVEVRKVPRWAYFLQGMLNFPRFAVQAGSYDARLFFE